MSNIPTSVVFDSKWREQLKADILEKIRKRHPGIDRGLQIEGVTLDNPTPENLAVLIVLQEIVATMREFSIVQWPGGIALVKTGQVEKIDKAYLDVNENSNYIIRGGSDKAVDLFDHVATPTGKLDGEQ